MGKKVKKSQGKKNRKKYFVFAVFFILISTSLLFLLKYVNVLSQSSEYANSNINNRSYPTLLEQEELIEYDIPSGWKKGIPGVLISSPDVQYFETNEISNGAQIHTPSLTKGYKLDKNFAYDSAIGGNFPEIRNQVDVTLKEYTINGNKVMNYILTWESTSDIYLIETDMGIWKISYQCAGCRTRQDFDNNPNTWALKYFLDSLKFGPTEE